EEVDAGEAGAEPLDVEAAQHDGVGREGVDDDAVRPRAQHAGLEAFRADGDRLRDGDGAEAARIEDVDLAARGGLRDRAGERLARRGAAARVRIVADAGNPGAGRLRVSD